MKNKKIVEKLNRLMFLVDRQSEEISCLETQNEKQAEYIIKLMKESFINETNRKHPENYVTLNGERTYFPYPVNWSEFHYDDSVIKY